MRTGLGRACTCVLGLLATVLVFACQPTVIITSTRNPDVAGGVEPTTFIIFQANTPPVFTSALEASLNYELRRWGITGRALTITGAEFNEEEILEFWASRSRGIVVAMPAGGTMRDGSIIQMLYDVRAFGILGPNKFVPIWRGRVNAADGAAEERMALLAKTLVARLVYDRVLPPRPAPAP
jgi:hypothetical protein